MSTTIPDPRLPLFLIAAAMVVLTPGLTGFGSTEALTTEKLGPLWARTGDAARTSTATRMRPNQVRWHDAGCDTRTSQARSSHAHVSRAPPKGARRLPPLAQGPRPAIAAKRQTPPRQDLPAGFRSLHRGHGQARCRA